MAKQLNVNLNFTSNTSQVKQNLMELQNMLTQISAITPMNGMNLSKDMQIAISSAKELQQHLNNAFNVKTGNLDLNKLNMSLNNAGANLGTLSANLLKAGKSGEQAFMNMQRAISGASVQINQANGVLTQFWTTLKNTARWQISSSVLHGFMGALQSAWGYAKDLDKSLNDIRIVTGYNSEKMAEFAEQANKAAKALNTTTTAYTNASLIYYQQGLSEAEVIERTNITVKMANVTAKSAAEVSDQLTAIWNNFDDGSKSLEYYVDVITALGAATASSTDEISQGLEKFAAVAETVGLSYEYATAALATVTAETRQSADVVGTAFKTLFARIQGLKLGETLDDGTTLNQYSSALAKVGIDIKNANGELKDMDIILNEMGEKWEVLNKDQQVALAQAVGGIRQYNQLISLMDNWDVFKTNLDIIATSSGTLQQQAEIYADSWEAAQKRVQATAQGIYRDLFPTEDLTDLANGFAVFLEGVDGLIEGLGGLKGILALVATIALNAFQNQIGTALQSVITKVSSLSMVSLGLRNAFSSVVGSTQQLRTNLQDIDAAGDNLAANTALFDERYKNTASSATQLSQQMTIAASKSGIMSASITSYSAGMAQINNLQATIEQANKHLTAEQREQLSLLQQQAVSANEQAAAAQMTLEAERERQNTITSTVSARTDNVDAYQMIPNANAPNDRNADQLGFVSDMRSTTNKDQNVSQMLDLYKKIHTEVSGTEFSLTRQGGAITLILEKEENLYQLNTESKKTYSDIYTANQRIAATMQQQVDSSGDAAKLEQDKKKSIAQILTNLIKQGGLSGKIAKDIAEQTKCWDKTRGAVNANKIDIEEVSKRIREATDQTYQLARASGASTQEMKNINIGANQVLTAEQKAAMEAENLRNKLNGVGIGLKGALDSAMDTGHILSGMASGVSSIAMGLSSITNAWNTLNNEEATFVEQLSAGSMAAVMGLQGFMAAFKGVRALYDSIQAAQKIKSIADTADLVLTGKKTESELAGLVAKKLNLSQDEAEIKTKGLLTVLKEKETNATTKDTVANWANVASQAAKLWYVTLIVAAVAALVAITIALVTAESKAEKQAKRSAKAAEEMKESSEDAANALNDIKSAFEAYDTAVQKLEECREGTEEWNNALKEVNNTVLKILQDVPELGANANLFVRDPSTGMLTINESEKENVLAAAEQKANTTAALSVTANAIATMDRMAATAEDLSQQIGTKGVGAYDADYGYQDYINVGKILTDNATNLAGLAESEYRAKVNELLQNAASDMARSYSGFDQQIDELVDSAVSYQTQINTLVTNTEAAAQQMRTAFQLLTDQNLGNSYGGAEKSMAAVQLEKRTTELKDAYEDLMTSNANTDRAKDAAAVVKYTGATGINQASTASNAIYKEIAKRLAEATNNEYVATTGNTVLGNDDNRRFIFDKGGERVEKSAAWVAQQIAAAEALKELGNNAATAAASLNTMDQKLAKFGLASSGEGLMRDFISTHGFEGQTIGDLKSFQESVAGTQGDTWGNASKKDIAKYLDMVIGADDDGTIDDPTAVAYGFNDTQDMVNQFYNALTAKYKLIESLTIDDAELMNFDQLSEKAAVAFDTAYKQMNLGPLGAKAGETFISGINGILNESNLDTDKQVAALEKLAEIDWSETDALQKVQAIMGTLNADFDIAQWKEFSETMRIAYGAIPDFTKIKDELTSIGVIIADLKFGSIIKEEDFEVLANYSAAWQDLFILQADGSRKFIGNANDMRRATQQSLRESGKDLLEKEKYANDIKSKGIKVNFTDQEVEEAAGGDGKDGLFGFYEGDRSTQILKDVFGYDPITYGGGTAIKWTVDENGYETGHGLSQKEASELVMNYQRGVMAENLINDNEEVRNALKMQGYKEETWNEIINNLKQGKSDERFEVMMNGLNTLVSQDYEQLSTEFQQMLASTATSFGELNQMLTDEEIALDAYKQGVLSLASEQMAAATSISELEQIWSSSLATGVELDYSIYADNLLKMAESYSICADEAQAFSIALQSSSEEVRKNAETNLEATIMLGEAAEKYGFQAEELSVQSKQLAKEYNLDAKAAAKLTIENQRMNKGVETLVNNWDEWSQELKSGNKLSRDWAKAAAECTKVIADLVGASEDLELPADFFDSAKNMDLLSQAAEGSTKAINELGLIIANAQIQMLSFQEGMQNAEHELIDQTQFDTWKTTIMSGITDLQNALNNVGMGTDAYEKLGGDKWITALNEMAIATQMSVDQMNSILNSMGVQAEVEVQSVKQMMRVPTYTEVVEEDDGIDTNGDGEPDAHGYHRYTIPGEPQEVEGYVQVAQIKTADSEIGPPKIKYTGNGNVSNSAKTGGSGKSSKASPSKKSDVVDRYKEITDKLNDQAKAMDKASNAADRLWGPNRIKAMREVNKALSDNIDLLKDKRAEAEYNLSVDKANLATVLKESAGKDVTAQFDKNGNIINYDEIMNGLYAELKAAETSAGSERSENEQKKIDGIQERIDKVKEAIAQYDETNTLIKDLNTEIQDSIYEWQDNNYTILNLELEYKLDINEKELEIIDYYLGKIEDDLYACVEAMSQYNQQSAIYTDNLKNQEAYVNNLTEKYNKGEISEQAYKEGLASSQSAIISNLQSLEESKKAMQDYYGNVMTMAIEEIGIYTAEMEQLNSVLDHYSSIIEIVGKQDDYSTKNKILNSKANNIKKELAVQTQLYEKSNAEAEKWAQKMSEATVGSNEYETYKKNWQAAQQATNEAQDAMLSKTEEWAKTMKSIVENELADFALTMEQQLTGGTSFDELITSMERRSSLQEEYLTTTNKIYETNKMINTAQQAIDKTTNTIAKQKLKSFQQETAQLQNNKKLSQYELEIQQAKYDLLLAEIALQEAQQAKSTVRLQRDSEGNFGYVYTADASAVSDAEQKLADAQNNLYNIGLDGANDYQQKYIETLQESQEAITELTQMQMNGEISSEEEFNRRKQEIIEYYNEKLQQYSHLHSVALSADSRVVTDAWSSDFIGMIASTDKWQSAVDGYFTSAAGSMATWAEVCATTLENSKLNDLDKELEGIDIKSKALITTLLGEDGKSGLVGALMDQVEAAGTASESYIPLQNEIDKTTKYYENLLLAVNEAYSAISNPVTPAISTEGGSYTPTETDGKTESNSSSKPTLSKGQTVTVKESATHYGIGSNSKKMASFVPGGTYTVMNYNDNEVLIGRNGIITGWVKKNDLIGFNTGGYTGSWGSEGKMAMLHEKELILNADDTTNFLASLEVLREIVNTINLHSMNAQLGGLLSTPHWIGTDQSQILEQQVHIEASFPGVQDRNEIEEAFNNLINRASQFVNRK